LLLTDKKEKIFFKSGAKPLQREDIGMANTETSGFDEAQKKLFVTGLDGLIHYLQVDAGGNLLFDGVTLAAGGAPVNNPTFTGTVTVPDGVNPTDAAQFSDVTDEVTRATTAEALLAPKDSPAFTTLVDAPKHATAGGPAFAEGRVYYDTTLHKLRVGTGAAYETITSS
jgi:hypothetical protein